MPVIDVHAESFTTAALPPEQMEAIRSGYPPRVFNR
jgi:hypothetical protein